MSSIGKVDFHKVLEKIWEYYTRDINCKDIEKMIRPLGFFKYPEVCHATVEFWYEEFSSYTRYYVDLDSFKCINRHLPMEFLRSMIKDNPYWTVDHFMDALKVSESIITNSMQRIGYPHETAVWINGSKKKPIF